MAAPDTDTLLLRIASHVALFAGMGRPLLEQVLSRAEKVARKEGLLFFDEGDEGESFYVLLMGKVSVEKRSSGKWVPLVELKPGDTFGEMTLIDEKVRSARVRAVADSVALYFNGARLKDAHEAMAIVYRNIARMQTRRLKAFNAEVAEHRAQHMEVDPAKPVGSPAAEVVDEPSPDENSGGAPSGPSDEWQN